MAEEAAKDKPDEATLKVPEDETKQPGEKGGNQKIMLILVGVLIVLNLLTILYFVGVFDGLLGKKNDPKKEATHQTDHTSGAPDGQHNDAAPAPAEPSPDADKHDEGPAPKDVSYVDVPELMVNLNSKPPAASFLKITVTLEVANADEANKIKKLLPRLTDQYIIYLRSLRVDDLKLAAAQQRIKEEMLTRTNAALAPLRVQNVLFKTFLTQ